MEKAYVTADGAYGVGDILLFQETDLTERQWLRVDTMNDNDRYDYVQAILAKDDKTIGMIEEN